MRYYCSICKQTITENVYRFSMNKYGKALCMEHQKALSTLKTKPQKEETELNLISGVQKIIRGVSQVIKEAPIKKETDFNKWISNWRQLKKLDFSMETKHFFLSGMHLDEFTKELIRLAKDSIYVVNPYLENCYLTDALIDSSNSSIKVKIVTRQPEAREIKKIDCHNKLRKNDIFLRYDNQIHSKIIVVDDKIVVASSMNFYSGSSGGASKEAGIVSLDEKVAHTAKDYTLRLIQAT